MKRFSSSSLSIEDDKKASIGSTGGEDLDSESLKAEIPRGCHLQNNIDSALNLTLNCAEDSKGIIFWNGTTSGSNDVFEASVMEHECYDVIYIPANSIISIVAFSKEAS